MSVSCGIQSRRAILFFKVKKIFLLSIALKNNEADVKKLAKQVYTVPKCSFVVFCVENEYWN